MSGKQGFTLVEVIMALLLFSIIMGGLVSAGVVANSQLKVGQNDVRVWEAASYQMETLIALGYDSVSSGSDTIQGYPTAWTVSGTNPKQILLVIDRTTLNGGVRPDSFVTYLSDPDA